MLVRWPDPSLHHNHRPTAHLHPDVIHLKDLAVLSEGHRPGLKLEDLRKVLKETHFTDDVVLNEHTPYHHEDPSKTLKTAKSAADDSSD